MKHHPSALRTHLPAGRVKVRDILLPLLGSLFSSVLLLDPDPVLNSDLITPSPWNPSPPPLCFLLHLRHWAAAPRSPLPFQGLKLESVDSQSPCSWLPGWGCILAVTCGQRPHDRYWVPHAAELVFSGLPSCPPVLCHMGRLEDCGVFSWLGSTT